MHAQQHVLQPRSAAPLSSLPRRQSTRSASFESSASSSAAAPPDVMPLESSRSAACGRVTVCESPSLAAAAAPRPTFQPRVVRELACDRRGALVAQRVFRHVNVQRAHHARVRRVRAQAAGPLDLVAVERVPLRGAARRGASVTEPVSRCAAAAAARYSTP